MVVSALAFDAAGLEAWPGDKNAACLFHAARARGIAVDRVTFTPRASVPAAPWLRLRVGKRVFMYRDCALYQRRPILRWRWRHINGRAPKITAYKNRTNALLQAAGCPTPVGRLFLRTELDAARAFFLSFGRAVCVKPVNGTMADTVSPGITDVAHFEAAFSRTAAKYRKILVEESVSGEVIRFMYLGEKLVATRHDRAASVVGDGARTITELVAAKNAEAVAKGMAIWGEIAVDADSERLLQRAGMALDTVPDAGRRVYLGATSNIGSGAEGIGRPEGLHPSYGEELVRAVRAIPGLVYTAFDVMIADHRAPSTSSSYWILDVNSEPGIANFHFPREGHPQDVAGAVLDWIVAGGAL